MKNIWYEGLIMGYFLLSMSEEEEIVNSIKANLKIFEDVKYDPSYIYLITLMSNIKLINF